MTERETASGRERENLVGGEEFLEPRDALGVEMVGGLEGTRFQATRQCGSTIAGDQAKKKHDFRRPGKGNSRHRRPCYWADLVGGEEFLEPRDTLGVEMVGGLVEQQQVRPLRKK